MASEKKDTEKSVKKLDDVRPDTGSRGKYNFPNARLKLIEQDDEKREFMAKVLHNAHEFFKVGLTPVKNNDELCERLNYYFEECERTQQLPTVEKMCLCIGYPRTTIFDWETGAHKAVWVNTTTSDIIKKAKEIMAAMDAELAQEGKIQPVVYMFRSKNFYGLKDQTEYVLTPNTQQERNADELISESKLLPGGN
jgi:hypothetical protein